MQTPFVGLCGMRGLLLGLPSLSVFGLRPLPLDEAGKALAYLRVLLQKLRQQVLPCVLLPHLWGFSPWRWRAGGVRSTAEVAP
jgi:hypothetical protein